MSYPVSIKAVLVGIAVLDVTAFACSSGDDGQADAPASASTAAVAEDEAAGGSADEYTLAQQFDLSIEVTSSEFDEKRRIPRKYRCTEEDISPAITWSGAPEEAVSIALLVDSDKYPESRWVLVTGCCVASRRMTEGFRRP
jgi:hypothetical protein